MTALVPSLGIKLRSGRSYLQRHHLLPPPPPPGPQPPSPSSVSGSAAAARAPPVPRPHPLLPTLPPLVTRAGAEPRRLAREGAPGRARAHTPALVAPLPPTPTRARARRASPKQRDAGPHPRFAGARQPGVVGRAGRWCFSPPLAPWLKQASPGVRGPRLGSRAPPPAPGRAPGAATAAASPRGPTRTSTLLDGSLRGSPVSKVAAVANLCAQEQATLQAHVAGRPRGLLRCVLALVNTELSRFPGPLNAAGTSQPGGRRNPPEREIHGVSGTRCSPAFSPLGGEPLWIGPERSRPRLQPSRELLGPAGKAESLWIMMLGNAGLGFATRFAVLGDQNLKCI